MVRRIKYFIVGLALGTVLGLWFGVNIGKDQPFYANPFVERTLKQKVQDSARGIYRDAKRNLRDKLNE